MFSMPGIVRQLMDKRVNLYWLHAIEMELFGKRDIETLFARIKSCKSISVLTVRGLDQFFEDLVVLLR